MKNQFTQFLVYKIEFFITRIKMRFILFSIFALTYAFEYDRTLHISREEIYEEMRVN